eukprot:503020-Pleurochrysis_carterae.AAC.1
MQRTYVRDHSLPFIACVNLVAASCLSKHTACSMRRTHTISYLITSSVMCELRCSPPHAPSAPFSMRSLTDLSRSFPHRIRRLSKRSLSRKGLLSSPFRATSLAARSLATPPRSAPSWTATASPSRCSPRST